LTEDGPRRDLAELYGIQEMPTADYPLRTEQNVRDAHAVLWFGDVNSPGGKVTRNACAGMGRPVLIVAPGKDVRPSDVADWIERTSRLKVLNIAGNRESRDPGIGARVERFLASVFRRLGFERVTD
jgi:hypothetical protein